MSKLEELLTKLEALVAEIEEAKKEQKTEDLKTVRQLCKAHGFTANMLKGYLAAGRKPSAAKKVANDTVNVPTGD